MLAQIDGLDASLEHAVEAYDSATQRLGAIEHEQSINRNELSIARQNLKRQQSRLANRLVALYTSGDSSTLGVILGATSLDDLLSRVDTVNRVSDEDARVVKEIKHFKRTVTRQKQLLAHAHESQAQVVSERAAAKASIDQQLAERRQLAASIRSEIVRLEAEERARQERLRREAEARLAEQQRAAAAAALQAATAAAVSPPAAAPTPEASTSAAPATAPTPVATIASPSESVGVVASTPEATVAPPSQYGGAVGIAMQYLGTPYVWGGASPGGFDCSGLVVYVYAQLGLSLPHYTGALWNVGTPVTQDQLEPGDLVFFNGLGHMGIYIGGGQFIHAPHTGDVVKISNLSDSWYAATYDGARRIL